MNSDPFSQAQPQPQPSDDPRFGHLGAPRPHDQHEIVGNINASAAEGANDPRIEKIKNMQNARKPQENTDKPSYSFKLIKTDNINAGKMAYFKWGVIMAVIAIIILISVSAAFTQGFLLVKDRFFDGNGSGSNIASAQNGSGQNAGNAQVGVDDPNTPGNEAEPRGSDDGRTVSESSLNFTPLYKVANADQLVKLPVTAKGYYVADIKTGERIMEKGSTDVYPIASVSKLMTAVIAHENMDPQKVVVVSRDSYNAYGAQGELLPGEKIKLGDLMFPLLMESSNDAAEVIAESYGRVDFMSLMNKKSAILGMHDTYFEDPSGLNAKNVSSSEDLFKLLKYIKQEAPGLLDMTRVRQFEILKHKWFNKNRFLNSDIFIGGKNGYIDESLWTTASLFDITMAKGGKRQIGIVLLKSTDREGDAFKLIRFIEKNVYFTETGSF